MVVTLVAAVFFCLFVFLTCQDPPFFFFSFFKYTQGACFSKSQKAIWTEAKKKSLAILYIVKDSVYTCVALHSCA